MMWKYVVEPGLISYLKDFLLLLIFFFFFILFQPIFKLNKHWHVPEKDGENRVSIELCKERIDVDFQILL